MGKIIWLASYPKSGNTWVRMLLNNYFSGDEKRQQLDQLDLTTFGGSSKSSYRQVSSAPIETLSDQQVMTLTPNAHAYIASRQPGLAFVKTHNLFSTYYDIPLITPSVTQGSVYIIRNPLDMALSVADHFGFDVDRAIDFINNENGSTAPTQTMVRQIYCSWTKNVESWTRDNPLPVHVVRYEDLHAEPLQSLKGILQFLGETVDGKRCARAIKQSSFKALKGMENKGGFSEKSRHSKAFFRSGKMGQWKSKLSQTQIERIVAANYQQMKKFDYLPDGF